MDLCQNLVCFPLLFSDVSPGYSIGQAADSRVNQPDSIIPLPSKFRYLDRISGLSKTGQSIAHLIVDDASQFHLNQQTLIDSLAQSLLDLGMLSKHPVFSVGDAHRCPLVEEADEPLDIGFSS